MQDALIIGCDIYRDIYNGGIMMLIRGVRVIDPLSGMDRTADIETENGVIRGIRTAVHREDEIHGNYEHVIDGAGLIAAPGLIDVHSHFRDPGQTEKETLASGAAAAARGGYTTVICMANTVPPVDSPGVISDILERAENLPIRLLQTSTVTEKMKGKTVVDMELMARYGAAGFTDDGRPITDPGVITEAMRKASRLGMVISLHEEDPEYVGNPGVNAGNTSLKLGLEGADRAAEEIMVERDCLIAKETGARIDIQHVSSAGSVELIRLAKKGGADVWCEATPHHFSMTEEIITAKGTMAKMNPPLRTEADRLAIIKGLQDGTIEIIATDHAPHTREEKERPFAEAPSGIIGLETSLALGITNLVKPRHLDMMQLLRKLTCNPAEMYGLDAGVLTEGAPADIVLFDPDERWTVSCEDFASKSCNSPFIGCSLLGRVKYTICRGSIVYEDGHR